MCVILGGHGGRGGGGRISPYQMNLKKSMIFCSFYPPAWIPLDKNGNVNVIHPTTCVALLQISWSFDTVYTHSIAAVGTAGTQTGNGAGH